MLCQAARAADSTVKGYPGLVCALTISVKLDDLTRWEMSPRKIPVFKPLIEPEEMAACAEALRLGWLGMGSYVGGFEQAIGRFLGLEDRHVVAVGTGHAALHLALVLAGVGPGDEIITPSFNNAADFQAILVSGAQPVFCDIDA